MTSILSFRAENLTKRYKGRTVVSDVSLEIRPHEVVGLLGPNGAGKTTTFRMMLGLVRPNEGRVQLNGIDVTSHQMNRRCRMGVGYMSQEPSIFRGLTAEENITAILQMQNRSAHEIRRRCGELMEQVGISHVAGQFAITLSGGEKRRLELGRCLACNPSFILLDEPFAGVDPIAVAEFQDLIWQLRSERDMGILVTDHNVRETLAVIDRAYMINQGRVEAHDTAVGLIRDPHVRNVYLGRNFEVDINTFRAVREAVQQPGREPVCMLTPGEA